MNHLYIVTHTDLDGVASAAAAIRILGRASGGYTVVYAEPYNIHQKLGDIEEYIESGDLLVVADLGPNKGSYKGVLEAVERLAGRRVEVEWYDHHIWSREELEALQKAGARIVVDTSTCATGVVVRHMPPRRGTAADGYLLELERVVCSADLWRWDHYLSAKLFRVLGDGGGDDWRNRVLEKLASGVMWDEELEDRLQDYITRELRGFNRVQSTVHTLAAGGCRIAAAAKSRGPPANSFIGAMLLARYNADVAVIIRPNGGLSLRSRSVDVQRIASLLGGGGHPRAAGAKIGIPLPLRLLARVYPRLLSIYAARRVARAAAESGSCEG